MATYYLLYKPLAVYFDDIEGNNIHYTLRLRHEADWQTDSVYNPTHFIGPLDVSKYVTLYFVQSLSVSLFLSI